MTARRATGKMPSFPRARGRDRFAEPDATAVTGSGLPGAIGASAALARRSPGRSRRSRRVTKPNTDRSTRHLRCVMRVRNWSLICPTWLEMLLAVAIFAKPSKAFAQEVSRWPAAAGRIKMWST
jgi:hypothetical protein